MIGAIVLASMFTALEIIEAALAWHAQSEYLAAADRGQMGYDVWTPYDFAVIPFSLLGIASYVVTCLWLYKVRTNHDALFPSGHQARSKGWVWGGWVCPIVSLWFPFQVVRDVANDPREFKNNALIGWWWAFWLLSMCTVQIGSSFVSVNEIDTSATSALGTVETINALITITAFVLWIRIIRRINSLQDRLLGITQPTQPMNPSGS